MVALGWSWAFRKMVTGMNYGIGRSSQTITMEVT